MCSSDLCFDQIGLKPSIKIPVYNGSLECEFRKYSIFDGKMKDFRSEGGVVKTEEEKRQMAEKHRFKKNREFKKRLEEDEENAEADIRSFKFRSLERKPFGERRSSYDDDRKGDRKGKREFGGKRFDRDDRRGSFKGGRDFKRGGRGFDNED